MTSREHETASEMEHREMDLLLPWYVNGTLERREARQVKRHLALCAGCRQEVETLRRLRSAVLRSNEEVPSPSARGLEQVLARIGSERPASEGARALGWQAWWDRLRSAVLPAPLPALRLVPVLVGLVIVVQFATIVGLVGKEYLGSGPYRTLSGPPDGGSSPHPRIVIVFQDGVSERAARELLVSVDGTVVKGPSPQGAYTVEIRRPLRSPQELERLVDALRGQTHVVKVAERAS